MSLNCFMFFGFTMYWTFVPCVTVCWWKTNRVGQWWCWQEWLSALVCHLDHLVAEGFFGLTQNKGAPGQQYRIPTKKMGGEVPGFRMTPPTSPSPSRGTGGTRWCTWMNALCQSLVSVSPAIFFVITHMGKNSRWNSQMQRTNESHIIIYHISQYEVYVVFLYLYLFIYI